MHKSALGRRRRKEETKNSTKQGIKRKGARRVGNTVWGGECGEQVIRGWWRDAPSA